MSNNHACFHAEIIKTHTPPIPSYLELCELSDHTVQNDNEELVFYVPFNIICHIEMIEG